jgi:hypothetical protein
MDNETSLMESDFLPPAADLEQLIGTLLLAINAQVEADESRAELSLAAWQEWLAEEGYPIHEAIEQFCKHVAIPHQAELNAIKSELLARLHDPSGLSVLADVIDAQQPEIAENLHAFMERATAKAQETFGIAGGTHTAAYVGGGTLAVILLAGGIAYRRRSVRLAQEGLELMTSAKHALRQTEERINSNVDRAIRGVRAAGGAEAQKLLADPALYQHRVRAVAHRWDGGHDNIKLILKKDVKKFSKGEIERHALKYSEGLAEESLGYLERHDGKAFKAATGFLRSHFKIALLEEDGRVLAIDAARKKPTVEDFAIFNKFNISGIERGRNFSDFPEVVAKADKLAKEKIQSFFAKHFKKAVQDSFKVAKESGNAEVKQIDLAFNDAYKKAMTDMEKEINDMMADSSDVVKKFCRAERAEADRLEAEALQVKAEADDEIEMIFEDR